MSKNRKKDWYAVAVGWRPGIYNSWYGENGAQAASSGHKPDVQQGFDTYEEALEWQLSYQPGIARQFQSAGRVQFGEPTGISVSVETRDGGSRAGNPADQESSGVSGVTQEIGRWGEHYAYRALMVQLGHKYAKEAEFTAELLDHEFFIRTGNEIVVKLGWRNELGETGECPDILLTEKGRRKFFEVKTTRSVRARVKLTTAEYQLACEKGPRFCLAVVRRAMYPDASVTFVWDPVSAFGIASPASLDGLTPSELDRITTERPNNPEAGGRQAFYGEVRDNVGRIRCRMMVQVTTPGHGRVYFCRHIGNRVKHVVDQNKLLRLYGQSLSDVLKKGDGRTSDVFLSVVGGDLNDHITAIRQALSWSLSETQGNRHA